MKTVDSVVRLVMKSFLVGLFLSSNIVVEALTIDTVPIGDPGNAGNRDFGLTGSKRPEYPLGSVDYVYRIGKFEVTNAEYVEFLNAVAKTDTHGLYNHAMGTRVRGGIVRSGTRGNYSYAVRRNMANKPVTFTSFWDETRFTNWLHNGQPVGPQDSTTTEDGAYTLGGVTNPVNTEISRNVGAKWFIPSQNEWYKAAFFQPASKGGDPSNYWLYTTASNVPPTIATATATGDISNPGSNVVNHARGANWNGTTIGNVTTVGSAGPASASYYGTFDQAGNVWDRYERILHSDNRRGIWGGGWINNPSNACACHEAHSWDVSSESSEVGFRVARSVIMGDMDSDFDVDFDDIREFVVALNNPVAYEDAFGVPPAFSGDMDGDGDHDFDDIAGFASILTAPQAGNILAVPEPSVSLLVLTSLLTEAIGLKRRRHHAW